MIEHKEKQVVSELMRFGSDRKVILSIFISAEVFSRPLVEG